MVKKWIKNLQMLANDNKTGKCPFCKSENTEHSYEVINQNTHMGYGAIWCNDCKKAFHMSRVEILPDMRVSNIPNDLDYL